MREARRYLNDVKARLATSAAITAVEVVTEWTSEDRGYFRARLTLANADFLEVSEYFVLGVSGPPTVEYRHQWMEHTRQKLIRRWDNAGHFPGLPNFPHHMHVGDEAHVLPGHALSIIELIDLVEQELDY